MQGEILFIAKFGSLVMSLGAYYFWIVKPMAIFNERQRANKKDIEKFKTDIESISKTLTILHTQHEDNMCGMIKSKKKGQ